MDLLDRIRGIGFVQSVSARIRALPKDLERNPLAALVIRERRPEIKLPFKMWLYPLPALIALAGWLYILGTNDRKIVFAGLALMLVGVAAWLWQAWRKAEWPFEQDVQKTTA